MLVGTVQDETCQLSKLGQAAAFFAHYRIPNQLHPRCIIPLGHPATHVTDACNTNECSASSGIAVLCAHPSRSADEWLLLSDDDIRDRESRRRRRRRLQTTNDRERRSERTSLAVILLVDRDRGAQEEEVGSKPVRQKDIRSGFRVQYIAVFIASAAGGGGDGDCAVQCSSDRAAR